MTKKILFLIKVLTVLLAFVSSAALQVPAPISKQKQTIAGKYATAAQAYQMWKTAPDKVRILDCRTPQE